MSKIAEFHLDLYGEEETITVYLGQYFETRPDGSPLLALQAWTEFEPFDSLTVNLGDYGMYPVDNGVYVPRKGEGSRKVVDELVKHNILEPTGETVRYGFIGSDGRPSVVADEFIVTVDSIEDIIADR